MDARTHTGHVTGGLGYLPPSPQRPFNYMSLRPIPRGSDTGNALVAAFTVTIAKWRTAALATRGSVEIRCLSGQLWITQPGDSHDIVLQAGQSHTVLRAMRDIVLSTVGSPCPAALEIVPAGAARNSRWHPICRPRPHFQLDIA
jgi:hypothetical protein